MSNIDNNGWADGSPQAGQHTLQMQVEATEADLAENHGDELLNMLPDEDVRNWNDTAKSFPFFLWDLHFLLQHIFEQLLNVI